MDDLSGSLHCENCGAMVTRYEAGYINVKKKK